MDGHAAQACANQAAATHRSPVPIRQHLHAEVVAILGTAELRERIESLGADPKTAAPDEFAAYIRSEISKGSKVVRDAGVSVQ